MNSDLLILICEVFIVLTGLGLFALGYLAYLDWLWSVEIKRLSNGIKRPAMPIEDVEYREIARFD